MESRRSLIGDFRAYGAVLWRLTIDSKEIEQGSLVLRERSVSFGQTFCGMHCVGDIIAPIVVYIWALAIIVAGNSNLMALRIWDSFLMICLFLLASCSDKRDFETYLHHTGIELKDAYTIDSIQQAGLTDWTLESYVKISDRDNALIVKELNEKLKFAKVRTEKEYYDSIYQKGDSLYGFIIESKYYFGIYETRSAKTNNRIEPVGYQTYELVLDTTTNNMYFKYEYE